MSDRVVLLGMILWLILASTCFAVKSYGQDAKPCEVIRDYMTRVDRICILSFGKYRRPQGMPVQRALFSVRQSFRSLPRAQ